MSTQTIYRTILRIVKERGGKNGKTILDIGAGRGTMLQMISSEMKMAPFACDFHTELFKQCKAPIEKVNFNAEPLPYADDAFDIVTCSEVVEHVENYRGLLRQGYRVLKKGGVFVVTTPNVLNMKSRARFFASGFYNLFGPLPVRNEKLYSTGGHITPIPCFYLVHAMLDAGFRDIRVDVDRYQKTSLAFLALTPLLLPAWLIFLYRERKKYGTISPENEPVVKENFTLRLLSGRTIIVSAVK